MDEAEERHYRRMTQTPVPRLVTSLAIPTTVTMLISSIYSLADTYFVSHISTSASGAVGVVFSLMSIIQAVGFGIGMGAGSIISQSLGRRDMETAERFAATAFLQGAAFGLLLMVVGLKNLNGLMGLLGSTETILPYAAKYGFYILLAAPVMCTAFVINIILRLEGKAFFSMLCMTAGGVLNIILDPLLIFKLHMGISGAAVATAASQCLSFVLLLQVFLRHKSVVKLDLHLFSRRPREWGRILAIGAPTICRQGLASVATAAMNIQAKPYGDAAISAVSIATKIYVVIRSVVIGIGQGAQPVLAFNYGAEKYGRVRRTFWFTVAVGTVWVIVCAVAGLWNSAGAIALFRGEDAEVVRIGAQALRYLCMVLPLLAFSSYVNQLLQVLGRSKSATFLASCRQGVMFLPLIFTLPRVWGLTGILLVQPLADLLTFLICIPFLIWFLRGLPKDRSIA